LQIAYTALPSDANTGITWASSAANVATVSQTGLVTPVATGTATITASSTADPSIYDSCVIVVIAAGTKADMSGWRFANVTDPAGSTVMSEGTTLSLPEFINGRMVVRNRQGTGTGTIDSNGATDVSFVWFNTPLTGNFTIRARVLVSEPVAASTAKGANLGAFGLVSGALPYRSNTMNLATMMVRTANGGDRLAYSRKGNGLGTSTAVQEYGADVPLAVERVYEVRRDAGGITYSVYASDSDFSASPAPVLSTTLGYYNAASPNTTLAEEITASYPMYAGFTVQGANVEISNLVISDDSGVLYQTAPVAARPVKVSSVKVSGTQRYPTDTIDYQNSLAGAPATMQLTASVVPSFAADPTVSWSSSNAAVATVDATGLVTIQGAGTATITATANDGTGFSDSFVISLSADAVPVTGIVVNGSASMLTPNAETFTATVSPPNATNQEVTWSTSDAAVASVNASTGVVTAEGAGTAIITATAADGSGVTGTLEVTVAIGNTISWRFLTLPADWPVQDLALAASTSVPNATYPATADIALLNGLKINLFDDSDGRLSRTCRWAVPAQRPAPAGSDFSDGCLQTGGSGIFGYIQNVQGPFSIKLNYTHTSSSGTGRYPRVSVDGGTTWDDTATPTTGSADYKSFTYSYSGTDAVTVELGTSDGLRIFDIVLTLQN
jgi:uncharacterized protein YjdB